MNREYYKWHSPNLDRDMEILVFGHSGARVIVFPTSCGRFYDWENREMLETLRHQIEQGDIQVFCVDGVDAESWWNMQILPAERAKRHLQYHDYIIKEVLPFTKKQNSNDFVIALGASMGAYHAMNLTLRFPESFDRCLAMSGPYDFEQMSAPYNVFNWIYEYNDDNVAQCNPVPLVKSLSKDHIEKLKKVELIFPIGQTDPLHDGSRLLAEAMTARQVPHAFITWDGFAHDWPYWQQMILLYLSGQPGAIDAI
ncbi:MAG: esterase [Cyanobacteria bacterium REEB67]|nr:esterase [Cyanobacteria bacterium REEB67]